MNIIRNTIMLLAVVGAVQQATASELSSAAYVEQIRGGAVGILSMLEIATPTMAVATGLASINPGRGNLGLVWQEGVNNEGRIVQSGSRNVGLIRQIGMDNVAAIDGDPGDRAALIYSPSSARCP